MDIKMMKIGLAINVQKIVKFVMGLTIVMFALIPSIHPHKVFAFWIKEYL